MPEAQSAVQLSESVVPFCILTDPWYLQRHQAFSTMLRPIPATQPGVVAGFPLPRVSGVAETASSARLVVAFTGLVDPLQPSAWRRLPGSSCRCPGPCP